MDFKLDNSIGFLLNRTNTKMKNNLLQHLKIYDVTTEQWAVLNCLWEKDEVYPKKLAELTSKDLPTIVRILSKLENKNFITKTINPKDNRSYLISLTDEGKKLESKLIPLVSDALNKALKGIDGKEIEDCKTVLNKIFNNLL